MQASPLDLGRRYHITWIEDPCPSPLILLLIPSDSFTSILPDEINSFTIDEKNPLTILFHLHTISTLSRPALSFQLHPMSSLHQNADKATRVKESGTVSAKSSAMVDFPEDLHYTTMDENDDGNHFNADDINQSIYIKRITQTSNDDDVFWSIASNTFFIGGGLLYMIGSCWDLSLSNSDGDPQNKPLYYSIWILGPFVYLLNSIIDVTWAIRTMVADKKRRDLRRFFFTARHQHAAHVGNDGDTGRDVMLALEKFDSHASFLDEKLIEGARLSGKQGNHVRTDVMTKLRRHFGHRRDLSAATTFGLAAIFGTASAIGWARGNMSEDMVYKLELISIHLYLLSAVFALVGRRHESPMKFTGIMDFFEDAKAMESVGDILFGIASIVDVVLDDFTFDDDNPWWPILSAVLWMADSLFYLRGDFVVLYRRKKE